MMRLARQLSLVAALTLPAPALAAPPSAEMLVAGCITCHADGAANVGQLVPVLDGQHYVYLLDTLRQYATGQRPASIMDRIARGYSDKEKQVLARYFSKRPYRRPAQETDPASAERGKQLANKRCGTCHLDEGRRSDFDAPLIAGQWKRYIELQMNEFLAGKRPYAGFQMEEAFAGLKPADVEALASYYASRATR